MARNKRLKKKLSESQLEIFTPGAGESQTVTGGVVARPREPVTLRPVPATAEQPATMAPVPTPAPPAGSGLSKLMSPVQDLGRSLLGFLVGPGTSGTPAVQAETQQLPPVPMKRTTSKRDSIVSHSKRDSLVSTGSMATPGRQRPLGHPAHPSSGASQTPVVLRRHAGISIVSKSPPNEEEAPWSETSPAVPQSDTGREGPSEPRPPSSKARRRKKKGRREIVQGGSENLVPPAVSSNSPGHQEQLSMSPPGEGFVTARNSMWLEGEVVTAHNGVVTAQGAVREDAGVSQLWMDGGAAPEVGSCQSGHATRTKAGLELEKVPVEGLNEQEAEPESEVEASEELSRATGAADCEDRGRTGGQEVTGAGGSQEQGPCGGPVSQEAQESGDTQETPAETQDIAADTSAADITTPLSRPTGTPELSTGLSEQAFTIPPPPPLPQQPAASNIPVPPPPPPQGFLTEGLKSPTVKRADSIKGAEKTGTVQGTLKRNTRLNREELLLSQLSNLDDGFASFLKTQLNIQTASRERDSTQVTEVETAISTVRRRKERRKRTESECSDKPGSATNKPDAQEAASVNANKQVTERESEHTVTAVNLERKLSNSTTVEEKRKVNATSTEPRPRTGSTSSEAISRVGRDRPISFIDLGENLKDRHEIAEPVTKPADPVGQPADPVSTVGSEIIEHTPVSLQPVEETVITHTCDGMDPAGDCLDSTDASNNNNNNNNSVLDISNKQPTVPELGQIEAFSPSPIRSKEVKQDKMVASKSLESEVVRKQQLSKSDSGYSGAVSCSEEEAVAGQVECSEEEAVELRPELSVNEAMRRYHRRVVSPPAVEKVVKQSRARVASVGTEDSEYSDDSEVEEANFCGGRRWPFSNV